MLSERVAAQLAGIPTTTAWARQGATVIPAFKKACCSLISFASRRTQPDQSVQHGGLHVFPVWQAYGINEKLLVSLASVQQSQDR
jgi:hypothetical protein